MKKEQFIAFIEAPASMQAESIALLSRLTQQFPYCQTAQLLLAKALHNENSIGYSDQLKIAAAYASDRKVLYHLIMSKPAASPAENKQEAASSVTLTVPQNDTELLNNLVVRSTLDKEQAETVSKEIEASDKAQDIIEIESPALKKEDITKQEKEAPEEEVKTTALEEQFEKPLTIESLSKEDEQEEKASRLQEPGIEETGNTTDPAAEQESASGKQDEVSVNQSSAEKIQEDRPETVNVESLPLLEKNIIVEAIDASIEREVSENMPFRETEPAEEEASTTEKAESTEAVSDDTTGDEDEGEEFDPNKTYSFTEWLKLSRKAKAKAAEGNDQKKRQEQEKQPEKDQDETRQDKKKQLDDLIDKFIAEEPKISRPSQKQEFFSPVNMARQSVQDDNDFVTETLANIYLKQGSFAKALKAYETLSLKFPEKKLYFAGRIKEIKKIIKEQK